MWLKDPDAVLDWQWDWADWLADAETITDHAVSGAGDLTVNSTSATGTAVTAWLSGGTAGQSYTLTCHVVTSAGRQDDRSISISVDDR